MKAEDLKRLEVFSDPQVSPTGEGYAFVSTTINKEEEYESDIYYYNLRENEMSQWTFGKGKNTHPRFSPDSKYVVFHNCGFFLYEAGEQNS